MSEQLYQINLKVNFLIFDDSNLFLHKPLLFVSWKKSMPFPVFVSVESLPPTFDGFNIHPYLGIRRFSMWFTELYKTFNNTSSKSQLKRNNIRDKHI